METAIQKTETPQNLISQAIEKGASVEQLKELMDLQDRWEAKQAKKAFLDAITKFQGLCPEIRKNKKVDFELRTGGRTAYNYAPLQDITRQIAPVLQKCGLSYRWENVENGEDITVKCFVSHSDGHNEMTAMTAKADASGSKNAIQARGSAISYLRRYTLTGALGITSADADVDGEQPADMDALHKEFMEIYNQVIQKDGKLSSYHPDNWKKERTGKTYKAAIKAIREELTKLTPAKA